MVSYFIIASVVLGAIFGSFLLVVALRYNTGKSLQGRSHCFSCRKILTPSELIPIVSYLAQRGRCTKCCSRIPLETLGSELLTAATFGLIAARGLLVGTPEVIMTIPYLISSLILFALFSVLIVIFFYDIHHKIIPDHLSLTFGILALVSSFFLSLQQGVFIYQGFQVPDLWHLLGGVIVPLPFVLIWIFSKGRLIGLGDPKLMVGMGFLFGTAQGISSVFVSFWLGSLVIFSFIVVQKVLRRELFATSKGGIMKQEIPFGPFLILGTLATVVFNINLF
jgi:leader peptidase (prepilin peptidase)/N-methyltransferase